MTIVIVLIVALALGAVIPSRWIVLAPLAVAGVVSTGIVLRGHDVTDTPIAFLVILTTLAIWGGTFLRPRRLSH